MLRDDDVIKSATKLTYVLKSVKCTTQILSIDLIPDER